MSDINIRPARGGNRVQKLSTRVDLTPMVDLGFLLITFFIFTTSMNEPKSMKLRLPADAPVDIRNTTVEDKTLNLVLLDRDRIGYYKGTDFAGMRNASYGQGLREVIVRERTKTGERYGNTGELVVLIKPTPQASYRNVVQVLDEMVIDDVSRYVLMEPELRDLQQPASTHAQPQ